MKRILVMFLLIGLLVSAVALTACSNANNTTTSSSDEASMTSTDTVGSVVDDQLIDENDSVEIGSMV